MRLIGDIHGALGPYMEIASGCDFSVQVGDFGVGFGKDKPDLYQKWCDRVEEFHASGNHRFIRGNHDELAVCKNMKGWIPDGAYASGVMFIGGAQSTDIHLRKEGFDWWADEELSFTEFSDLVDYYETVKPDVMITHDAPKRFLAGYTHHSLTRNALDMMFEIHKPSLWVFGHHHTPHSDTMDGCHFICLGINHYIDI